jgi:hypothetical protein
MSVKTVPAQKAPDDARAFTDGPFEPDDWGMNMKCIESGSVIPGLARVPIVGRR